MSKEYKGYGLSPEKKIKNILTPVINYHPPKPKKYNPAIGLVGTGGIAEYHLKNYRACGFNIVALANRTVEKAELMREKFFPDAKVYSDYHQLLKDDNIEVVDVTPHPAERLPILHYCLDSGKHVLSQKPFVLNYSDGKKLVQKAEKKNLKFAVNQSGRWAPHFCYIRNAIKKGILGNIASIDFNLQWDQTWIKGIPSFEKMDDLILFDFGIHWFDITSCFMESRKPQILYASTRHHSGQVYQPPALASIIIDYDETQVRISFNGHCTNGEEDVTTVVGSMGTIRSRGTGLNEQNNIELYLENGSVHVPLKGSWFESGFQGTMGELLCAIEDDRQPYNSALNNLKTLELCFAAQKSFQQKSPIRFT